MKLTRTIVLLSLPLLFAACSVRQLNDGSWTDCKVGDSCQVGPRGAASLAPTVPMHNNKKHHVVVKHKKHVVKKPVAAPAPATSN